MIQQDFGKQILALKKCNFDKLLNPLPCGCDKEKIPHFDFSFLMLNAYFMDIYTF